LTKPPPGCILGPRFHLHPAPRLSRAPVAGIAYFVVFTRLLMPDHRFEPGVERVHLTVDAIPSDVARQIRDFQVRDPEFLRRVLLYGITHQTVFETLSRTWRV
jgi:hypothetical protein